jgi:hypothetical protein
MAPRPFQPPEDAQLALGEASRLVQRDDFESRGQAIDQLEVLVRAQPRFIEAHSALVVALAFQVDDLRLMGQEINAEREGLERQIARLRDAKAPSDWENRVNVLTDQLAQVQRKGQPLYEQSTAAERRLDGALERIANLGEQELSPEQQRAQTRAQAMNHAVRGTPEVMGLLERYRQQGGQDGWDDIALAEYAANGSSVQDVANRARTAIRALREQDASFVRLYLLEARLARAAGERASARSALEAAVALNPQHTLARQLLDRLPPVKSEGGE